MANENPNLESSAAEPTVQLEGGAYEIIRNRLLNQGAELRTRLGKLNHARKEVFGSVDFNLLSTDRISTENNCTARDIVAVGDRTIFGYNVHMGLRTETKLSDVFSIYRYEDRRFHQEPLDLIQNEKFAEDFGNLYKYYRETVFVKFEVIGIFLYMVFRIGKSETDIKAFKWRLGEGGLRYVDSRSEADVRYPTQHEFAWKRAHRDMQRSGEFPHVSILDRLFVQTIGGTLTIKVEDNTDHGRGILEEEVAHKEQSLDDAEIFFADLGNIILLRVRPFQEKQYRYFAYNEKVQQARRIDSIAHSCILLPDDHGIIFADGYYLQTGEYKRFESGLTEMHFEERIQSPNGEDYLYVFYNSPTGTYVMLSYNIIAQQVETPITCNGFCHFENGELCYFKAEDEPRKHHAIQIWQTPYVGPDFELTGNADNYLFKIGNRDIVRAMAECQEVLILLNKEDTYANLYLDLGKLTGDILDSYYWLDRDESFQLDDPLKGIRRSAENAIEEFEKVVRIRRHTAEESRRVSEAAQKLIAEIKRSIFDEVNQFVRFLAELRNWRGEAIGLKELRYVDLELVQSLEEDLSAQSERLSQRCVEFLLREDALRPYEQQVAAHRAAIEKVNTAAEAATLEAAIEQTGSDLELLVEIVSNLKIEDATQTTKIIDHISNIYSELNQARAALRRRRKELVSTEAVAEFASQIKLLSQAVINFLDVADTPEKVDEYLTKLMVQVEELEGKFSEFDEFIGQIAEKREEIYNAFESRKVQLVEARNKKAAALFKSAERILSGIRNRVNNFGTAQEINGYFAGDLMIDKVRDVVEKLRALEDNVKAEDLQSRLKTIREDALRQLKDRQELFVDGENIIRLGRHKFSVNVQSLDLTVIRREDEQYFHLTGTNFFELIRHPEFEATRPVWDQELVSENSTVYRAEYLAYLFFAALREDGNRRGLSEFAELSAEEQGQRLQQFAGPRYQEGYAKGVHDQDALRILRTLVGLHRSIGLLRYLPEARACAAMWWDYFLDASARELFDHRLQGVGFILQVFPDSDEFGALIGDLRTGMAAFCVETGLFREALAGSAAEYLFHEISAGNRFVASPEGTRIGQDFLAYLDQKSMGKTFEQSLKRLEGRIAEQFQLLRNWVSAYVHQQNVPDGEDYIDEAAMVLFRGGVEAVRLSVASVVGEVEALSGDHPKIGPKGAYRLDYNHFMHELGDFTTTEVPAFERYQGLKKRLTEEFRKELRLNEFQPRVLSSFVRNKLIDEVYLPLFGDNLAKQIGTVGENKRTDRQGLLLLISPPGYGKTTLMEYIANRLGLIFMKVNGPAIGHSVRSLDPEEAPNAAAREELQKLNLALEMGDNIMLYLDDIQHCNPEFLQKFISLCDAQRKIEGVYKDQPKTYDLRGKRVCVVMAGNPYTESGDKFQIPDMLANRADTYNLGDIIGDTAHFFELSLIENSLSSNVVLQKVTQRAHKDIHGFLQIAESNRREGIELEGNYAPEDVNEIVAVLQKLLVVRDVILKVNQEYIRSAGMSEEFRTLPAFKLQGSYRDMNKLAEKIIPIMNEQELMTLIMTHYESESQTLTNDAEANLLRFKELIGFLKPEEKARWQEIQATFLKKQRLLGVDASDKFGQVIAQLGSLVDGIEGMRKAMEK
ncbi:MAG: DNA repair ATPase [Bacteroidota bacterium]